MDAQLRLAKPTTTGVVVPPLTTTGRTTYRLNLHSHTPRKPSPLNPAARRAAENITNRRSEERYGRREEIASPRDDSRRARTVSPAQKILRRKAAKVLQTNTLRKQVEVYEARALENLSLKSASSKATNKKGKGKQPEDNSLRIGITITSPTPQRQSSQKKRRRRWGSIWVFITTRPVVTALGKFWPFEARRTTPELGWLPAEPAPIAASAA
ncbi:hypothetical protein LIA77_07462 [Sarocladium implicatum]|nr:hypothetical protein LIA77_07462 [Sarocladium implicatum]